MPQSVPGEVFTASEVARAAGVALSEMSALLKTGEIKQIAGTPYIAGSDAIRAARRLKAVRLVSAVTTRVMFSDGMERSRLERRASFPAIASSALHAALVVTVFWFSTGAAQMEAVDEAPRTTRRLVFIMAPGAGGGGGGGGGSRNPLPAARLHRRRTERPRASLPAILPTPVAPEPVVTTRPPDPPPSPPVVAPVVPAAAEATDREGVIEHELEAASSRGPGDAGGVGTGQGTGNGEGSGSGIGDGFGGGAGGGPYRQGNGIEPPRLLHEIKAEFTEEARRRGVTGDVLLEIVVRRDGFVGDVSVVRGLGAGLDQRAVEAVRLWRFSPARRQGTPVDVIVEVAVEFTLR